LSAPGVPIEFPIHTPSGALAFKASSYSIDLGRGTVSLSRPQLFDPDGKLLAAAERVAVTGIDLRHSSSQVVNVFVSNLYGRLTRLKNGKFELQYLIPPRTGKPSSTPFYVTVNHAVFDIEDQAGTKPFLLRGKSDRVVVAGVGDTWVASSTVALNGVGTASAVVHRASTNALSVDVKTDGLELSGLADHLKGLPESAKIPQLKDLSATSILLKGPVSVAISPKSVVSVRSTSTTTLTNIKYKGYSADLLAFRGEFSQDGAVGHVDATVGRLLSTFDGSAVWNGKVSVAGRFDAQVQGPGDLPNFVKQQLPPDLGFGQAHASGWVSFTAPKRYSIHGTLTAANLAMKKVSARTLDSEFAVDPYQAVVHVRSAMWTGQSVSGGISVSLSDRSIRGGIHANNIDLRAVARSYGRSDFAGGANADIVLRGTVGNPEVIFDTAGRMRYMPATIQVAPFQFEARGSYQNGRLVLNRADVTGAEMSATVQGSVEQDQSLRLHLAGRRIQLSAYSDLVSGQANVEADLTGTLAAPIANGRLEGYDVVAEKLNIPLVTTDFVADKRAVSFTHARAIQGSAQADASGRYDFVTKHIIGEATATGVQLADYLGENYVGVADVRNVSIVGSLRSPLISGEVIGNSLVVQGIKVDHAELKASADRNGINLDSGRIDLAEGVITATGQYEFETKQAQIHAVTTPLKLSDLTSSLLGVSTGGTISGQADALLEDGRIVSAKAGGRLKEVVVNGTSLGDGPWNLSGLGTKLSGSLEVGQLDRFVSLHDFTADFGPVHPVAMGQLDLYHLSLHDLLNAGKGHYGDLSPDASSYIDTTTGNLNASISFSGEVRDPAFYVTTLDATELAVQGMKLGNLTAKFGRKSGDWSIDQFRLSDGPGILTLKGSIIKDEELRIDGELSKLKISSLAEIAPKLAGVTGEFNSSFSIDGDTKRPKITASISAEGLFEDPAATVLVAPSNNSASGGISDTALKTASLKVGDTPVPVVRDRGLRIELSPVTITETAPLPNGETSGGIQFSGICFYRGLQGQIEAQIPWRFPSEIPDDEKIVAKLTMANRSLKDIAAIVGGIDVKRTDGLVGGMLTLTGTLDHLELNGDASLQTSTFGLEGIDEALKDFKVDANIKSDQISVSASGTSLRGGSFKAKLDTPAIDLSAALTNVENDDLRALLANTFAGSVNFDQFKFKQGFLARTYVQGTVNGTVDMSGTFRNPSIKGSPTLSHLDTVVPSLTPSDADASRSLINPSFDLNVTLADQAHVTASAAELYLLGSGSVQGTLAAPEIKTDFVVTQGNFKFPAATIRLDEGGTVKLNYSNSLSRLDVSLSGQNQSPIIVPGNGDVLTRYTVTLNVDGNLLDSKGLNITTESDPPDLSQTRVLELLGQTDLLQNLNTGSGMSSAEAQRQAIQGALAGFALPSLVSPISSSIAKSLGFDYLEIGFNPYQETNVSFAKSIGSELTFQGSRGLSQPPPGYPFQYDYRLVLHPRRFGGILSRFSLFLGTDQDNPYKLGLIYSSRFGSHFDPKKDSLVPGTKGALPIRSILDN
jgi:hypothetical protein